jgi:hypothetical protein
MLFAAFLHIQDYFLKLKGLVTNRINGISLEDQTMMEPSFGKSVQ